ncbi:MAG: hypothetical protein M1358_10875 [Chloroflexi bacterium]|nr:hypothetical protein [Chloroflexota bacterium]
MKKFITAWLVADVATMLSVSFLVETRMNTFMEAGRALICQAAWHNATRIIATWHDSTEWIATTWHDNISLSDQSLLITAV